MSRIKCPNCGSTAQMKRIAKTEDMAYTRIYDQWKCGCGAIVQVTFERTKIDLITVEKTKK